MRSTVLLLPIVRAWISTFRWNLCQELPARPCVFACWHSDLVAAAAFFRGRRATALVSASRDGELLVEALSGSAIRFARGSSAKGGGAGARACLRALSAGRSVATTWDGPRGPAGIRKRGPTWLSEAGNAPLLEVGFRYGARLRLRDWSAISVPFPFSRIDVILRPAEAAP